MACCGGGKRKPGGRKSARSGKITRSSKVKNQTAKKTTDKDANVQPPQNQ